MAINKPNEYEKTQASGAFEPIALGGHRLIIKQVSESTSKNGDPMIVVLLDTDKNDVQPNYFSKQFANDIRPDKKWPSAGTVYMLTEYQGKCTRNFKGFCTAAEKSTPGFEIAWERSSASASRTSRSAGSSALRLDGMKARKQISINCVGSARSTRRQTQTFRGRWKRKTIRTIKETVLQFREASRGQMDS